MDTLSSRTRALVLGGGGSTGNAWTIGVVAGLARGGVDVTDADLVVGTSAGATSAAQVLSADAAGLYDAIVEAPAAAGPPRPARPVAHLGTLADVIRESADVVDLRRRLGRVADGSDPSGEGRRRWRDTVASRLPSSQWPDGRLLVTAVDVDSGEAVVLDRDSGVGLADAIAASCSNGFGLPAYEVGGRRLLDGGYRTNAENADLAAGFDRVLVLSPFGGRSFQPVEWGNHLATQVAVLCAGGSEVEVIVPDPEHEHLFGANAMDVSARPAAARAGFDQGSELAGRFATFWR